jgi:DNA-binding response OmpR family regulator
MKILVIDDDEFILKILAMRLKKEGHVPIVASKAQDALKIIYKEEPDLIISDIMMPYMSGLELLNLVNVQLLRHIPIILMSALSNKEVIDTSLQLGAYDYIVKPLRMKELNSKIKRLAVN